MKTKKVEKKSTPVPTMTEGQLRNARRLIRAECANYCDGQCLVLDYTGDGCVCVQWISYSLLCKWFRECVLPLDEKLQLALGLAKSIRKCKMCGRDFSPKTKRTWYCSECMPFIRRQQVKEATQRYRENKEGQ